MAINSTYLLLFKGIITHYNIIGLLQNSILLDVLQIAIRHLLQTIIAVRS